MVADRTQGANWGSMMSISLRNELRSPDSNPDILKTYNWETWVSPMILNMHSSYTITVNFACVDSKGTFLNS